VFQLLTVKRFIKVATPRPLAQVLQARPWMVENWISVWILTVMGKHMRMEVRFLVKAFVATLDVA